MDDTAEVVGPPALHVVETEVDGRISLYDSEHQQVSVLNETASDVWRLCDGQHTLHEVVSLLARAYSVEPNSIREEVEQTVAGFRDSGLLVKADHQ